MTYVNNCVYTNLRTPTSRPPTPARDHTHAHHQYSGAVYVVQRTAPQPVRRGGIDRAYPAAPRNRYTVAIKPMRVKPKNIIHCMAANRRFIFSRNSLNRVSIASKRYSISMF